MYFSVRCENDYDIKLFLTGSIKRMTVKCNVTTILAMRTQIDQQTFIYYRDVICVYKIDRRKISHVCLFVFSFSSHSRTFHSYEDDTMPGDGLQILTYARHS